MPLTCEPLESRCSPTIYVRWDWTFGESLLSFRPAIEAAATAFAARLTSDIPLSAVPQHTAYSLWGEVFVPETPADTLRVYVGSAVGAEVLGQAAPLYDFNGTRSVGMSLAINPTADFGTYSLIAVVDHEVMHGIGVESHSDDPDALMASGVQPNREKPVRMDDVRLAHDYGFTLEPGPVVDYNPWGSIGWIRLTAEQSAAWQAAGTLGRWEPAAR